jgi:drug/metabolite transporter (DMT)-like permease
MQATILATPLVLLGFGRLVRRRGMVLLGVIFGGIVLVNVDQRDESMLIAGWTLLPVIVAAFAFPIGNQLIQEARSGGRGRVIPALSDPETASASARVMLMTLGSMPGWGLLLLLARPAWPPIPQIAGAGVVAVFATLVGFTLFLRARDRVGVNANAVARVDATQAAYTVFSLLGEVAFLAGRWPGELGLLGLGLVVGGLVVYGFIGAD